MDVTILTDNQPGTDSSVDTESGRLRVRRRALATREWGILTADGLRHHLRVSREIRALTRQEDHPTGDGARRPVIVHCARALPEGVACCLALAFAARPLICWAHGEDIASALGSRELTWLMKRVYGRAAAVLANSESTARMLREIGIALTRIHVIHPGVDTARFHPNVNGNATRRRFAAPDDTLLLTVGRLQRRKGHDLAIAAVDALRQENPRLRYLIVGDGDERQRLEQLVAARHLEAHVMFAGEVDAQSLPGYYSACDVFLLPNRIEANDVEGFGIVFLEAAAAGKPTIGGASGGVGEAINAGTTGLLVNGTDLAELAMAIRTLTGSQHLRRRMGDAGRRRVEQRFTWTRAAAKVAAVHHQLAAKVPSP